MGMHRYFYVMMGIKTTKEETPFDDYDERFAPYIEGYEGVPVTIHIDDNTGKIYIGHVLQCTGPWDEPETEELILPDKAYIARQINEVLALMPGSPIIDINDVKMLAFVLVM